ncbi:EAL domain-containing protein [Pseudomonas syringae]|uniref:EAL domain-containing protein n=1 Tax=Pseudomonas syringae TaxID=317 RepID=UPI0013C2DF57|nr:EAL domain-containing protein [Pseudomonas syringae]
MLTFTFHRRALVPFTILTFVGIAGALWFAQFLWLENNKYRVEAYANILLEHAESVALNLTEALVELDALQLSPCSNQDLAVLRKNAFEHRFIKDEGRIEGGKITCSAMWGVLKQPYALPNKSTTTRNHFTLWREVPSYAIAGSTMDISARNNVFVVTSPTAFAAFDSPPAGMSAILTSPDGTVVMAEIGPPIPTNYSITAQTVKNCSEYFDICVTAQLNNSIFSFERTGLILFTSFMGSLVGALIWYVIKQYVARHYSMMTKLTTGINADRIQVAYQPIVLAATGEMVGFEALARWYDKDLGNVPPDVFFKKARKLNLGFKLNRNIIRRCLGECADLLRSTKQLYLSINLDTESLLKSDLIDVLFEETKKNEIAPSQIAIEILESHTANMDQIFDGITRLRMHGYQVFIDDFGTGYSSLAYLSNLKIDKIKIDRTFTQSAGTDSAAAMILVKIYEISLTINAPIIFEGIETEAQRQAILSFCPEALAQGWFFSKAVKFEELSADNLAFPRTT